MKKDKSKIYMITGIIILLLAVITSTYAYYKYVFVEIDIDTITRGLDYYITYAKGTDITNQVLEPSTDYTGGNSVTVTLYKKDNTYDIYGHIYLDISEVGSTLSSSSALKYLVTDGEEEISSGTLKGITADLSAPLAVNIPLNTTSTEYTVYLWYDDTVVESTSSEGQTISATVRCEATMKKINMINYDDTAAYKIYSIFSPNTTVVSNNIKYSYDTTNNLMEDIDGNIRYYGASPNNYIYFNCSDYSNQTSDTCELWRIIGVFNGKVKIMRNSSIGTYSWDNKDTTTGAENDYGKNDWSDARLMKLLNPSSVYTTDTNDQGYGQSLYWNASSGTCFKNQNNATATCDFTTTGLKNTATRNLISESTWSIRGHNTSAVYADQIYEKEKTSGTVYSGRPTSWTGYVALAYPSDYGYAADLSQCNQTLNIYDNSTCTSNNWMKNVITNNGNNAGWFLTPRSGHSNYVWFVNSGGNAHNNAANRAWAVAPVLYLNSKQAIGSGNGSNNLPFQLTVT